MDIAAKAPSGTKIKERTRDVYRESSNIRVGTASHMDISGIGTTDQTNSSISEEEIVSIEFTGKAIIGMDLVVAEEEVLGQVM